MEICKNCGSEVNQNYCANCGQKTHLHKESAWGLIKEFFNDFTHFDSKFGRSLYFLLLKPGRLTLEYLNYKRMSYLNPMRMYIFITLVYFICAGLPSNVLFPSQFTKSLKNFTYSSDKGIEFTEKSEESTSNSHINIPGFINLNINRDGQKLSEKELQDSINTLMHEPQKGYFERLSNAKSLKLSHMSVEETNKQVGQNWSKNLPKMMFILLPLFALLLKLIYFRKGIYYEDHAIFSLHFHSFLFANFAIQKILEFISASLEFISIALFFGLFVYLFVSLKKVYKQSIIKTSFKFILLLLSYSVLVLISLTINGLISLMMV